MGTNDLVPHIDACDTNDLVPHTDACDTNDSVPHTDAMKGLTWLILKKGLKALSK
jgi:hypothetical protein